MDEVRKALDEEILSEINGISLMTDGCEAKTSAIDDLTAIYKMRLEEIRLDNELEAKRIELERNAEEAKRKSAEETKKQDSELKNRKFEKILDVIVSGAGIIMPLTFYCVWLSQGLQFEETGVFKSVTFKNLIHLFRPVR